MYCSDNDVVYMNTYISIEISNYCIYLDTWRMNTMNTQYFMVLRVTRVDATCGFTLFIRRRDKH